MIPGKKPASAAPSRKRTTRKLASFQISAMAADNSPQVTMIRAIQSRAPNLSSARLLGISKKKYPKKKIPAPHPNIVAVKPRSLFICSAAKPTLTRSR